MKDLGWKEAVQVIGQMVFKLFAMQTRIGDGARKNPRFKSCQRNFRFGEIATDRESSLYLVEKRMAKGTRDCVLRGCLESCAVESPVQIIRQRLFEPGAIH